MAPNGGTIVVLFVIVYASLAKPPNRTSGSKLLLPTTPPHYKNMVRQMMMQCQRMGHQVPKTMLMKNDYDNSGSPVGDIMAMENDTQLATIFTVLSLLHPVDTSKDSVSQMDVANTMWNCTSLSSLIKQMRNFSEASACYMRAFVAPLSWETLTMMRGDRMDPEDYDDMVWAAKPLLQNMPSTKMNLPPMIERPHMAIMMKMLKEVFGSLSEEQKVQVKEWVKEQVSRSYFNCTRKPTSGSESAAGQKPSTSKPTSQKPSESKPTSQKPSELRPTSQKAPQSRPTSQKPSESRPTSQKPSELRPTSQKAPESRPTSQKPSELRPTSQKPSESRPTSQKPSELRPTSGEENGKDGEEHSSSEEKQGNQKEKKKKKEDNIVAKRCPPKLMWLKMEVLKVMGPYLSRLHLDDVNSSPKNELCQFFNSPQFKLSFSGVSGMKPLLARTFLQRVQECSSDKKEFTQHVDRLGMLACFYDDPPAMNTTLSKHLLSQLSDCNNSRIKKLKKRLVRTLMSSATDTASSALLHDLDTGVTMLSPNQLSKFPVSAIKEALTTLGFKVKWRLNQARQLAKKLLGGKKAVSGKELMSLGSVVRGLPISLLKTVKPQEVLGKKSLHNLTNQMSKGQRKALLVGLRKGVKVSELVQKAPGPLLSSLSLDTLVKANLTSLDQIEGKHWNREQSAFLVRKIIRGKVRPDDIRKLGSAVQGITCKMINRVSDNDTKEMAQAIAETARWLSKAQVCCAARKLFTNLEKARPGYFQTITKEELYGIPTLFLIHLPPMKAKDLPSSLCPAFLDKMKEANLSSLPLDALSRPALTQRALQCLTNGTDISGLSSEEVSRLGLLLCELPPSQLRLMAPDALNSSLQAMASCPQIPPRHKAALFRLLMKTYGDPSDWSAETMESMGPLLLLNDTTIHALPYKSWLKEVLSYLKDTLSQAPVSPPDLSALRKKLFFLSIKSLGVRRKREVDSIDDKVSAVELIEELSENNVYWTPAHLQKMTVETFTATVETLGSILDYSTDQLAMLINKATEAWGPVTHMNESLVIQLGCVSQGFSDTDLEKLPISLDTLEAIAHCGWNESQMKAVWKGFAKHSNLTAGELGAVEIVALNQFICGLSSDDIGQLNMDAFKEAVDSMHDVQCSLLVTEQLKGLAVAVFGQPSTWTEADVSTLGNIIVGLNEAELGSLDPSVFSFLSQTSIPLIPADNFAALSISQLEALGPDNAAMVTNAQRAVLGIAELAALDKAQTGSRAELQTGQESGAPSLSIEGIAAFMKPFLFLLLGFLLL